MELSQVLQQISDLSAELAAKEHIGAENIHEGRFSFTDFFLRPFRRWTETGINIQGAGKDQEGDEEKHEDVTWSDHCFLSSFRVDICCLSLQTQLKCCFS